MAGSLLEDEIESEVSQLLSRSNSVDFVVHEIEKLHTPLREREHRIRALCRQLISDGRPEDCVKIVEANADYGIQAELALVDVNLGERFNVQRKLGQGATSNTFLVEDTGTLALFCFKMFKPEIAANTKLRDQLLANDRSARSLQHRGTARIIRAGKFGDVYGTLQEYVEGPTLKGHLANGMAPTLSETIDLICDLASAVQNAHLQGVVHGDLSLSNIILTSTNPIGGPVILDFGGGCDEEGNACLQTRAAFPFASPEQVQNANVDARTDVFSLGVILYCLLTGRAPFNSIEQLLKGSAPPASSVEYVPRWISKVCQKCLQSDPGNRYQSAAELARALREGGQLPAKGRWRGFLIGVLTGSAVLIITATLFIFGCRMIGAAIAAAVTENSKTSLAIEMRNDWDATFSNPVRKDIDAISEWLSSPHVKTDLGQKWLDAFVRRSPSDEDLKLFATDLPEEMQRVFFPERKNTKLTLDDVQRIRYSVINVLNLFENIFDAEATNDLSTVVVKSSFLDAIVYRYKALIHFSKAFRAQGRETAWIGIEKGLHRHGKMSAETIS